MYRYPFFTVHLNNTIFPQFITPTLKKRALSITSKYSSNLKTIIPLNKNKSYQLKGSICNFENAMQ